MVTRVTHPLYPAAELDFQTDGNLIWSLQTSDESPGYFDAFRKSPNFTASRKQYPDGWGTHSLFADPKFERLGADWTKPLDVRLRTGSAAIDSGVELPDDWPDPLRESDEGKPDIGALPLGTSFKIGRRDSST